MPLTLPTLALGTAWLEFVHYRRGAFVAKDLKRKGRSNLGRRVVRALTPLRPASSAV